MIICEIVEEPSLNEAKIMIFFLKTKGNFLKNANWNNHDLPQYSCYMKI